MRLLILGGTRFLGRHLAALALDRGHQVSLLHRGQSGPGLFPQAEHLITDRNGDLSLLAGRRWDAAIDTSAYLPRQVRHLAAHLAGQVGQYQLISTISVYDDAARALTSEDAPLRRLDVPTIETVSGDTYGGLKALCEEAAVHAFGDAHCLVARPGLIVGPFDPTGRFSWWVQRLMQGGEVLAPGDPQAPAQFLDARDAAAWLVKQAEAGNSSGRYNLCGPVEPTTMGQWLEAAKRSVAPGASPIRFTWVSEPFLTEHGVQPWTELPLWLPQAQAGLHRMDIRRAVAAGLLTRPTEHTVADTAAWLARAGSVAWPVGVGMTLDRERSLLGNWHGKSGHDVLIA
jgi:2'-hydroxyisoflavone reductase